MKCNNGKNDSHNLADAVMASLTGKNAGHIERYGPNGEFFRYQGHEIDGLNKALRLERMLSGYRQGLSRSRRPGWSSILNLPMLKTRIPFVSSGTIVLGDIVQNNFEGVCRLRNRYFYTWLAKGVRFWREASVQEISREYRKQ